MVDGLGRYCDICNSMKDVKRYHSVDLDICDKCLPYFKDMLDRWNNSQPPPLIEVAACKSELHRY